MTDIIIILIIVALVAAISIYLYKAKKRGEKCIGCPYAKQCGGGNCSCSSEHKKK